MQNQSCIQILNARGEEVGRHEAPSGYKFTGEYRWAREGERYLHNGGARTGICGSGSDCQQFILKPLPAAKERRAERLKHALNIPYAVTPSSEVIAEIEKIFQEESD